MSPLVSTRAGISARSYGLFGAVAAALGDYESIATVTVGAGGSSSISFTSIPSTYKHLQVRILVKTNYTTYPNDQLFFTYNNDTGSNYNTHQLYGSGSSAGAQNPNNPTAQLVSYIAGNSSSANMFGVAIIDILDYANTNKYKTSRSLAGWDSNGGGFVVLNSGLWMSTSAVNRIDLAPQAGTQFLQYSQFALYGIKG